MKNKIKKITGSILSFALAASMVFGLNGMTTFAAETEDVATNQTILVKEQVNGTADTEFTFHIYEITEAEKPIETMDDITSSTAGSNLDYVICDSNTDEEIGTGTTDSDGTFYLNEEEYAEFIVAGETDWYVFQDTPDEYPLTEVTADGDHASVVDNTNGVVQYSAEESTPTTGVDKSALQAAIEKAEAANKDDYTEDAWNALQEALEKAKDVFNDPDANQDDVNDALENLEKALEDTKDAESTKADKTALQAEYDEDIQLNEDDYTPDTWKPFKEALEKAKEVLDDDEATQDDVDEALAKLQEAKKNLEEASTTPTGETTDITVTKTWDDSNDQDGKRPENVTVHLLADGSEVESATMAAGTDDTWTCTFEDMPVNNTDGDKIVYTVTEDEVAEYTTEVNGYDITNSYTPVTGALIVEKAWDDNDNQDGKRPDSITVGVFANMSYVGEKEITEADGWSCTFDDLPVYENGEPIWYTVYEEDIEGYTGTAEWTDEDRNAHTATCLITNTYTPEETSVTVAKIWDDADDQDGKRPDSVTVRLLANGREVDSAELEADDDWRYDFTELPKYDNGKEITYTVSEDAVAGYELEDTIHVDGTNTFILLNSHEPALYNGDGDLKVTKVWDDEDNIDGVRPDYLYLNLYADDEKIMEAVMTEDNATDDNTWAGTFEDLPKYDNGVEIKYEVKEQMPVSADSFYDLTDVTDDGEGTITLTNTHVCVVITSNMEGNSKVYDGEPVILTADVNTDNLSADAEVSYQWVKVNDDGTETVLDSTSNELELAGNVSDSGTYKCVVTIKDDETTREFSGEISITIESAVDKSELQEEYDEDILLNKDDYTPESWAPFEDALANAEKVLADPDATQEDVEEALKDLVDAKGGLVKISEEPSVSGVTITATGLDGDNAKAYDGEEVTLTVSANVSPQDAEVTYTWYKDGEVIPDATGATLTLDGNISDSGTYKCVVTATSEGVSADSSADITITIEPRYADDFDEEIVEEDDTLVDTESVNAYTAVEIEMSTTLPYLDGADLAAGEYAIVFHDQLDEKLILDTAAADFTLTLNGDTTLDSKYYNITLTDGTSPARLMPFAITLAAPAVIDDGCAFHVEVYLSDLYSDGLISEESLEQGDEIMLFFKADLEGDGLAGSYTSTAWYEVYDSTEEPIYKSDEQVITVTTYGVEITKFDKSDESPVEGATFGIYSDETCETPVTRNNDAYTVTTDENGTAAFYGLGLVENTPYYVKETKAPSGYVLDSAPVAVDLSTLDKDVYVYSCEIANELGYITFVIDDEEYSISYTELEEAIDKAGVEDTFTYSSKGSEKEVTATFVSISDLLSDLLPEGAEISGFTVTASDGTTAELPADNAYIYKTDSGEFRTAVNGGSGSQWIYNPDTVDVILEVPAHTHNWEVTWKWEGLPKYVDCGVDGYEPLSLIQPWNVAQSLRIATLAGSLDDVTATATGKCECGVEETVKGELSAEYISQEPDEYFGALAEITATAEFSDGQEATDAKKVLAPATGDLEVDYLKTDGTTTKEVSFSDINTLINETLPFTISYTSGTNTQDLTMPFVPIETILYNYAESLDGVNYCCFMPYDTGGSQGQPLSHKAYIYQRDQDNTRPYYYRTAEDGAYGNSFWSNLAKIEVVYQHQWGTTQWEWADDYSSATVTATCTRATRSDFAVCDYSETVTTMDIDYEVTTEPTTTEPGVGTYTATATMSDGQTLTDTTTVEIPVLPPEAFAVYSTDDNSLTFYTDDAIPTVGDTYPEGDGKKVTNVYAGVDSLAATGTDNVPWYDLREDVTSVVIDDSFAEAQPISLAYWFDGYANAAFTGFKNIDTSEVTSLRSTFEYCSSMTELDLSGWDTAKVTSMAFLFSNCSALTRVDGLSGWDTSANKTMYNMFNNCSSLSSVGDLSKWDTGKVTELESMFYNCSSLTSVDVSSWDTSKVTYMAFMFYGCSGLTSLDVGSWDTSAAIEMDRIFYGCSSLAFLDVSNWATGEVTSTYGMFSGCSGLTSLAVSNWDTGEVTDMTYMFYNCAGLDTIDVSGWDTSAVTNMYGMFSGCSGLASLDLSGWDTTKVTDASRFATSCKNLKHITLGENTNIFDSETLLVDTQTWYDSAKNGSVASTDYLRHVTHPGDYWTYSLLAEYDKDSALIEEEYSESSWAVMEDALEKAEEVLNNDNASAEDVEDALAALQSAEAQLDELEYTSIDIVYHGETVATVTGEEYKALQAEVEPSTKTYNGSTSITQRFVKIIDLLGEYQPDEGCSVMAGSVTYGSLNDLDLDEIYIRHRADRNDYQMAVDGTRGNMWYGGVTEITAGHVYASGKCLICGAEEPPEEPVVNSVTIDADGSADDISRVYNGEGITLNVSADVEPETATVTYQWYNGSEKVNPTSVMPADMTARPYALAVTPYAEKTSTLDLAGNVTDSGTYYCVVTAENGGETASGTSNSVSVEITKATQNIEFTDGTEVAKTTGDEMYTNTLTDESVVYGDLSYSISAEDGGDIEDIASIDETSGEVTLKGAGTVVVTATAAGGGENYDEVSASYTLTITESPSRVVKYAVSIWGIEQDLDEDGEILALTFGPASGEDYTDTYKAHLTKEEYEAKEDAYCIHWMSWVDIIAQSEEDPSVFETCLAEGCTTTVDITLQGKLLNESYTGMSDDGDGASELVESINPAYQTWDSVYNADGGWPASRIRATLNGTDESTDPSVAGEDTLTAANCLFACLPDELQEAIVPKEVKTDTVYNVTDGSSTEKTYDNLWLFSLREMVAEGGGTFNTSPQMRNAETPGIGTTYTKAQNLNVLDTGSSSGIDCYSESGEPYTYWYRSLYASTISTTAKPCIFRYSSPMYSTNANDTDNGIVFGFCLTAEDSLEEPTVSNVEIDSGDISRVYNGEPVTLRVSADVTPDNAAVTYQWYKGETEVAPLFLLASDVDANALAVTPYAAVSSDCELAGNVSDSGVYTCKVTATNKRGSVSETSSPVTVAITKATQSIIFTDGNDVEKETGDWHYTNELTSGSVVYGDLSYSISGVNGEDVSDIATINEETGEVTLKGAGIVTVTVTATGSDIGNYDAASASYKLTITETSSDGKEELRDEYVVDSMITEGDYYEPTWTPFADAMGAAEKVLNDSDVTETDIEEALDTLIAARRALYGPYTSPDFGWYTDPKENVDVGKYTIVTANQMVALSDIVNGTVPDEYDIDEYDFEGETITLWDDVKMNPDEDEAGDPMVSYAQPGLDEGVATPVNTSSDDAQIFTPIGNATFESSGAIAEGTHSFKGTFNGGGHTIENLYIKSENGYLGLFGVVGSANYADENVEEGTFIGHLNNFTITGVIECTFDGSKTKTELDFVGAACGKITAGAKIEYVTNKAAIIAPYCDNVGGIVGFAGTNYKFGGDDKDETYDPGYEDNPSGYNTFVECCGNEGIVLGYHKQGGIVGENAATVRYCYNSGWILARLTGSKSSMGGIVGRNGNNGYPKEQSVVAYCYNAGTISNNGCNDTGAGDQRDYAGITGDTFGGAGENEVYNCYNIGYIPEGYSFYNCIASGLDDDDTYGHGAYVAIRNNYSPTTVIRGTSGQEEQETGIRKDESWFHGVTDEGDLSFQTCLGPYFVLNNDETVNDGYPLLWWQVDGMEEPNPGAIDSLTVVSLPDKVDGYYTREPFDPTGMQVVVTYADGTEELLLANYGQWTAHWYWRTQGFVADTGSFNTEGFPALGTAGDEVQVKISYGDKDDEKIGYAETSITVSVIS